MQAHASVTIITLVAPLIYFGMAMLVSRARSRLGIYASVMTSDPALERTIRAHSNTLEWLPIFLPSLWLFALYWSDLAAAGSLGGRRRAQ
jgi:uncharacterized membrane protein YecN with MAPEG domain